MGDDCLRSRKCLLDAGHDDDCIESGRELVCQFAAEVIDIGADGASRVARWLRAWRRSTSPSLDPSHGKDGDPR